jgi:hypothetical protein
MVGQRRRGGGEKGVYEECRRGCVPGGENGLIVTIE